jgi:hypothetical protein
MRVLNKRLWPHQFKMPVEHMEANTERIAWLRENLSRDEWRFNEDNSTYCFTNNDDAVMFKLSFT